jgi:hypothetical protein
LKSVTCLTCVRCKQLTSFSTVLHCIETEPTVGNHLLHTTTEHTNFCVITFSSQTDLSPCHVPSRCLTKSQPVADREPAQVQATSNGVKKEHSGSGSLLAEVQPVFAADPHQQQQQQAMGSSQSSATPATVVAGAAPMDAVQKKPAVTANGNGAAPLQATPADSLKPAAANAAAAAPQQSPIAAPAAIQIAQPSPAAAAQQQQQQQQQHSVVVTASQPPTAAAAAAAAVQQPAIAVTTAQPPAAAAQHNNPTAVAATVATAAAAAMAVAVPAAAVPADATAALSSSSSLRSPSGSHKKSSMSGLSPSSGHGGVATVVDWTMALEQVSCLVLLLSISQPSVTVCSYKFANR